MANKELVTEEDIHPVASENESSVVNQKEESCSQKLLEEKSEESDKIIRNDESGCTNKTHKRKFKDYFFDFFMLFLAIIGGFFTENARESIAERHKENQYISSLITDLQLDSVNIERILRQNERQTEGINALVDMLESSAKKTDLPRFYELTCDNLNTFVEFIPHDITIIQLKNSGGLRLIENKSVSDSIVLYYSEIDYFRGNNEKVYNQFTTDNVKLEMQFMDFNAFKTRKWAFHDTSKMTEFKNRAIIFNDALRWDSKKLKDFYKQASLLLKKIRKEYSVNAKQV